VDVFLYTDHQEKTWRSEGIYPPEPFEWHLGRVGGETDRGTEHLWRYGAQTTIYVVGTARAARGIHRLLTKAEMVGNCAVKICGPAAVREDAAKHPEDVIYAMRSLARKPVVGGFHDANEIDQATWTFMAAKSYGEGSEEDVRRKLMQHPAWFGLGFLDAVRPLQCAEVVAEIVDPRFFILPDRPFRSSRLKNFFGLTHSIQERVTADPYGDDQNQLHKRCAMLRKCWWQVPEAEHALARPKTPGGFLWRGRKDESARSDFRMSKTFLLFLRHTWTDAIMAAGGRARLQWFIPEQFFGDKELAEEFHAYTKVFDRAQRRFDST